MRCSWFKCDSYETSPEEDFMQFSADSVAWNRRATRYKPAWQYFINSWFLEYLNFLLYTLRWYIYYLLLFKILAFMWVWCFQTVNKLTILRGFGRTWCDIFAARHVDTLSVLSTCHESRVTCHDGGWAWWRGQLWGDWGWRVWRLAATTATSPLGPPPATRQRTPRTTATPA